MLILKLLWKRGKRANLYAYMFSVLFSFAFELTKIRSTGIGECAWGPRLIFRRFRRKAYFKAACESFSNDDKRNGLTNTIYFFKNHA